MSVYMIKKETAADKRIVADDMILTTDLPTCAGSKMLEGYQSLVGSEALARLQANGYTLTGKVNVGEFAIDLLGETSYFGACYENGVLQNPAACAVKSGDAMAALVLDVNGAPRRAAAQSGLVCLKPTYGTVSRYGTIPVACSGEALSVLSATASDAFILYNAMKGHDDKDGTSHADKTIAQGEAALAKKNKVALPTCLCNGLTEEAKAALDTAVCALREQGLTVCEVDVPVLAHAKAAWNILMSAELCNNVSRYDGVKYGYRSQNYTNIDELYTASRTEAFGDLIKSAILFGSDTLSTDNYMRVYDKALRMRRVVVEAFAALHAEYDAVLMPACSTLSYTEDAVKADKYLPYTENFYTAPASLTGLPAIALSGVQLVGKAFSEACLADLAQIIGKEVRL